MAGAADVARVVNDRMAKLGINQRELAEKSGVSLATVRKIQHGAGEGRNRSTLANISRALGLPDDHLWRASAGDPPAAGPGEDMAVIRDELRELNSRVAAIEARLGAAE